MRIPTWRLVLTGGAITILAAAAIGVAAAAGALSTPATDLTTAEQTAGPDSTAGLRLDRPGLREAWGGGRLLRAGRHLVHAEVTMTGPDGELVDFQLDHGTVQSIGGGTLTIAEAGGGTQTVSTSDATIVRVGRAEGDLGDVTVGAEVFVQSRIDGGTPLAKRIVVIPASAGT